jgi:hypothetical protein
MIFLPFCDDRDLITRNKWLFVVLPKGSVCILNKEIAGTAYFVAVLSSQNKRCTAAR